MTIKALTQYQAVALSSSGLTGATAASRYAGATASGAPSTGTFVTGDFVVAQNGHIWICTAGGTPGTWVDTAAVSSAVTSVAGRTGAVTLTAADIGAGTFPSVAYSMAGSTLILPSSTAPAQTAEGSVVWDSTNHRLTVGVGATRWTMVDVDSAQTIIGAKTLSGLLTANAGITVPSGQALLTGTRSVVTGTRTTTTNASDTVDLGQFSTTGGAMEIRLHSHLLTAGAVVTKVHELALSSSMGYLSTVTGVTFVGTTVTVTVLSTTGLLAGMVVNIAGVVGLTNVNGDQTVATVPTGSTFTFIAPGTPVGSYTSGGAVSTWYLALPVDASGNAVSTNDFALEVRRSGITAHVARYRQKSIANAGAITWTAETLGDTAVTFTPSTTVTAAPPAVSTMHPSNAFVAAAGNVGIGTESPAALLDISSVLRVSSTDVTINDGGTFRTVPRGLAVAPVQVTSPFGTTSTSSTVAITGALVTFAAVSGRWYEIVFTVPLVYFSAATAVSIATALRIIAGNSAPTSLTGTQIQDIRSTTSAIAGTTGGQPHSIVTYWQATGTGNFTIQAFGVTAATAGTYNWTCGATSPMNLAVENVG